MKISRRPTLQFTAAVKAQSASTKVQPPLAGARLSRLAKIINRTKMTNR